MGVRLVGSLTSEEAGRLCERSVLLLPLGSMEQHGPHLPLETDTLLANHLAQAIIARFGEDFDIWQLPALPLGLSREHGWAPGTFSFSIAGMTTLLRELAREVARSLPARNLMIVNGHGGNRGLLDAFVYELDGDFGFNVCVLNIGPLMGPVEQEGVPEIHAGRDETSLMLALSPADVRVDRISPAACPPDDGEIRRMILDPGLGWPWSSGDPRLAEKGVIGDASGASAERGYAIVDRIVAAAGGALCRLLENQKLSGKH